MLKGIQRFVLGPSLLWLTFKGIVPTEQALTFRGCAQQSKACKAGMAWRAFERPAERAQRGCAGNPVTDQQLEQHRQRGPVCVVEPHCLCARGLLPG